MCIYSPMPHTLSYCALIGKCALIRSNTVSPCQNSSDKTVLRGICILSEEQLFLASFLSRGQLSKKKKTAHLGANSFREDPISKKWHLLGQEHLLGLKYHIVVLVSKNSASLLFFLSKNCKELLHLKINFCSPGRSSGRAIVLSPALASALAKCLSFYVKVFLSPWPSNHKLFFVTAVKICH